jgi:hypothetical protein
MSENDLLMKPMQDCTEEELYTLRKATAAELKRRVLENLEIVADQYVELYGGKAGIEQMGEDMCMRIARGRHPGGWASLIQHLVKVSG